MTSYFDATCESGFSNILCAIPTNQGQATDPAGVSGITTGIYTGKGKTQTYTQQITFNPGDGIVIRSTVIDDLTSLPISNATVDILITGPETLTLITAPSDANGIAEVVWQTKAPRKNNPGTTPGTYTIEVKGVTATGYHWDGVTTSFDFSILP